MDTSGVISMESGSVTPKFLLQKISKTLIRNMNSPLFNMVNINKQFIYFLNSVTTIYMLTNNVKNWGKQTNKQTKFNIIYKSIEHKKQKVLIVLKKRGLSTWENHGPGLVYIMIFRNISHYDGKRTYWITPWPNTCVQRKKKIEDDVFSAMIQDRVLFYPRHL